MSIYTRLTHASTGTEAMLYALTIRHAAITSEFFTGVKQHIPTKKRRRAKVLKEKLQEQTSNIIRQNYPTYQEFSIEQEKAYDIEGDTTYPRYMLRVHFPEDYRCY